MAANATADAFDWDEWPSVTPTTNRTPDNDSGGVDEHWCLDPKRKFDTGFELGAVVALGSAASLAIVLGHSLVLLAFTTRHAQIFGAPGQAYLLYLVNLSICDLVIGLVSLPVRLTLEIRGCWPLPAVLCRVYQVLNWSVCYVCVCVFFLF